MSFEHPFQNEFVKIGISPETNFKDGFLTGCTFYWIGNLQDVQELPWPDPEQTAIYSAGHSVGGVAAGALPKDVIEGKRLYRGKLKWLVQNGQAFVNIFGQRTTTGSSPWTHTFNTGTCNARPLPSAVIAAWLDKNCDDSFDENTDLSNRFDGVKFSKTTFTFEQGEALNIESDIVAVNSKDQTAFPTTFTEISTKPYLMKDGTLTMFGSTFARVKSGSITLNHQVNEIPYDGVDPFDLEEGRAIIEASIVLVASNDDLFDLMNASPTATTRFSMLFTRGNNDTLVLESEASGTETQAFLKFKPKFGGGENAVEVDGSLLMLNFRSVVVDSNASYPV